jgi:hypothetical protein
MGGGLPYKNTYQSNEPNVSTNEANRCTQIELSRWLEARCSEKSSQKKRRT